MACSKGRKLFYKPIIYLLVAATVIIASMGGVTPLPTKNLETTPSKQSILPMHLSRVAAA